MKNWVGAVENAWTQQRDQAFWCGGMVAGRPFTKAVVKPKDGEYAYEDMDGYISYLVTEGAGKKLPVEGDEILWLFDNGYTFECEKKNTIRAFLPPKQY